MSCPSCGAPMANVLGRFVCPTCGWAAELEGLLTAYRLASSLLAEAFSPIEAERQEQLASRAAREIADLLVGVGRPALAGVQ